SPGTPSWPRNCGREPVSLGCHHSFCSSCLDKFWDQTKNKNCPVCKRKFSEDHPNKDYERKWFCEVEQRAVCHVCEFPAHHGHTVVPLEQAVKDLKEKLTSELDSLQSKQVKCKDIEETYNKVVQYSKKQLVSTERQIRGEFEKLHQFLREEEARLAALRKEEEEKGKMIAREMKNIQDQISSLTESITAVKQEFRKREVPFLKSYKHTQTFSRAQYTLPDPQLVSGALIDVAKHLGNLQFRVWEKMQGIVKYTPVILDPNTSARWLSLSDDLTSVSQTGPIQQLPDNPERNTNYATVLCSEGFSSGKHSWEVEVRDHPEWYIGVAKESINRKGKIPTSPDKGLFKIHLDEGTYWVGGQTLTLKRRPQRIRVQLDYDRGEVELCVRERDRERLGKGGYLVSCTTEFIQLKCVFRI
uniref:Tripartite motif containing 35-13 n=1 Tax=Hucho hucho TaxID=62062 RepID=A0A4W5PP40_9TELE